MQVLRMYSVFDSAVGSYMRPFFSDHKANAIRSFVNIVNDKNPDNIINAHPDQFTLFELGEFEQSTGVFSSHAMPMSLGNGVEFIKQVA